MDGDLDSIKLRIHSFQAKNDLEPYLEWEKKVDWIFDCYSYSEQKKVKLVVIEFIEYALIWWDPIVISRKRKPPMLFPSCCSILLFFFIVPISQPKSSWIGPLLYKDKMY